MTVVFDANSKTKRRCGECSLCCKLLPMRARPEADVRRVIGKMLDTGMIDPDTYFSEMIPDFDKPAGKPCPHQRHRKGCSIYEKRPWGCRLWNCRWLLGEDTSDLQRPDRSRFVIDLTPDYVTQVNDETGERVDIEVVQIWCDPHDRNAWKRDDALLAYLERRGKEGTGAIVRYSEKDAIAVFAPTMSADGEWHEISSEVMGYRSIVDRMHGVERAQQARDAI